MRKAALVLICILLSTAGCVPVSSERVTNIEKAVDDLRARVDLLEQKQASVEGLYQELAAKKAEATAASMTTQDVQAALKNAGYYTGPIDGSIGSGTDKAIKEFQQANGLKPDGIVGAKTKSLLSRYLNKEAVQ